MLLNNKKALITGIASNRSIAYGIAKKLRENGAELCLTYQNDNLQNSLTTIGNLVPDCAGVRRNGAASLDLAYVAAGRFDGFWEQNLSPWDMAAGIIIVKEAGGIIKEIDLDVYKDVKIIASSPDINSKLI